MINSPFKKIVALVGVKLFRLVRTMKRGLETLMQGLGRMLSPIGRVLVRFFVLPLYRVVVTTRLRIQRLALPARGFILFLITNRYLLHGTLAAMVIITLVANLGSRQAHAQDVGQKSLLFALATDGQNEVVEEVVNQAAPVKGSNYLGSATIVSLPHVDFDYDVNQDAGTPSLTVPGSIAAQPYIDTPTSGSVAPRSKTETYVVQDGDTISSIAQKYGVHVGTILWNNNLTDRQYIRPGDSLRIPPASGMLATIKAGDTLEKLATRYGADAGEIATYNHLSNDQLALGHEIMIPGGSPPEIEQTRTQILARNRESADTNNDGNATTNNRPPVVIKPKPVAKPTAVAVATPSTDSLIEDFTTPTPTPKPPDAEPTSGSKLFWPTSGHSITQYYGWQHTGLDIDGDFSSPIYAANDGVVEKAGWNTGGYGLMIMIDHPNGMKTRYGHTSKMFVKEGDEVKRGQVIAMMGTTGRSTGTHLHFEVYTNGARTNPLGYIR